jgi:hypothetical protein
MGQIIGRNITSAGYLAAARLTGKNARILPPPGPKGQRPPPGGPKVPRKIGEKMETSGKTDG